MSWPQITLLILFGIEMFVNAKKHGKLKTGTSAKYNFWIKAIDIMILGGLLYFGGFWQ